MEPVNMAERLLRVEKKIDEINEKLDKIFCELVAHTHASPEYFRRQTDMLREAMAQPPRFKEPR